MSLHFSILQIIGPTQEPPNLTKQAPSHWREGFRSATLNGTSKPTASVPSVTTNEGNNKSFETNHHQASQMLSNQSNRKNEVSNQDKYRPFSLTQPTRTSHSENKSDEIQAPQSQQSKSDRIVPRFAPVFKANIRHSTHNISSSSKKVPVFLPKAPRTSANVSKASIPRKENNIPKMSAFPSSQSVSKSQIPPSQTPTPMAMSTPIKPAHHTQGLNPRPNFTIGGDDMDDFDLTPVVTPRSFNFGSGRQLSTPKTAVPALKFAPKIPRPLSSMTHASGKKPQMPRLPSQFSNNMSSSFNDSGLGSSFMNTPSTPTIPKAHGTSQSTPGGKRALNTVRSIFTRQAQSSF